MIQRLLQPLWYALAILFLIEAWLWEKLEPVVAWAVALIPLERLKAWLADRVDSLSPAMTLVVFAVPVLPLFPLKLIGLWLLAHKYWVSAIGVILIGKLVGVGVTAFIFDVTKPKLLQMDWFRRLYERVLRVRAWARTLTEPLRFRMRRWIVRLRSGSSSQVLGSILRLRRRVGRSRAHPAPAE